jgi:chromosome segregation ATPase
MQSATRAIVLVACAHGSAASNPLGEVLALMDDLSAKVTKDGEDEAKAYKEYFEWCDEVATNNKHETQTASASKDSLEASIKELSANIEAAETKIGTLASDISTNSADLKAATAIREKESTDFAESEKELVSVIDTLGRAVTILERDMQKNPAALAQVANKGLEGIVQAMNVMVDAASFSVQDKQRLTALVQNQQSADEDDSELGAPAAATYKTHSSGIFDVLEDLKEKAEAQLSELRKAETAARHNYNLLKQSLEDQLGADNKDMAAQKSGKASAEEGKAVAEGELDATNADLKGLNEARESANANCMTVAADHQTTVKSREAELKTIAEAVEILKSTTSGAEGQTYSLFQVNSAVRTRADLASSEVVVLLKKLAREHHSSALAQLASRVSAVIRYSAGSADPFAKIKTLISDMITKLENESSSEATEKAYCDEEMAKTASKKDELNYEIEKLSTKIDKASSHSASLKADVKELQAELATTAKEQAESDKWRQDSSAAFRVAKADLTQGLTGVRKALQTLRDYYGSAAFVQQPMPPMPETHSASSGGASSIIGILEVVESDFAENLAKEETEEASAQSEYEQSTQEFKISKAMMEQDVKYKTQEFTSLDKNVAGLSSDRQTASTELSAVLEYFDKLKGRCIAKPESYEQRKGRRDAEIEGLKEALSILENEAAFLQKGGKHRNHHMRGAALKM